MKRPQPNKKDNRLNPIPYNWIKYNIKGSIKGEKPICKPLHDYQKIN